MTEEHKEEHSHSEHQHAEHAHDEHQHAEHAHDEHQHEAHSEHHAHYEHGLGGGDGGKKPFSKKISENYGVIGGVALILIALIGAYFLLASGGTSGNGGASPTPAAALALSVTRIRAPDCSACFDIDPILQGLGDGGAVLNVRVLDYSQAEAQSLVSKYDV